MEQSTNSGGFMQQMSPGKIFVFGAIQGLLVVCTIGFFILLSIFLKGGLAPRVVAGVGTGTGTNPTPVVQDDPTPANIVVKPVDEKNDHIRGAKNAKVTIIEFSDIECPFCLRFHETMQQVMEKYGKDVRWVYRHFPLESIHPYARPAANAAECAGEQGKFWEFIDAAFADQSQLGDLPALASKVGLNTGKFTACFNAKKFDADITADMQDGEGAGVQGTPFSIVIGPDGEKIPVNGAQPFSNVDAILSSLLQ